MVAGAAAGGGFDVSKTYSGSLFGKDRIGHTTPDAEAFLCTMGAPSSSAGNDKLPTLYNQAVSRIAKKVSTSNASMSRSGVVSKSSSSYNAATVR